ncbi:MAG: class I SAM-dependent RNA methyltransferase [Lachnospirales bacterium]
MEYKFIATTTFGLESTVKREVKNLDFQNIHAEDGKIMYTGSLNTLVKSNIYLRSADRVLLVLNEFKALEFEDLFQGVKAIDWSFFLPKDANFIVTGKSNKSQLSSVPACQSVAEKAIITKLNEKYNLERYPKTGATYKILVALLKNNVTITLDTTGDGLHKRGYRDKSVEAPLKETLAHGLIELSYWNKNRLLMDPTCGSGTILIEAAMKGRNIPPGIERKFISEKWDFIPESIWKEERKKAFKEIDHDYNGQFLGYDIDKKAIEIAKENAYNAGVDDLIHFETKAFNELKLPCQYGISICNPPYGERIGILKDVFQLYTDMGILFKDRTWSSCVITSEEKFQSLYGREADSKRKLYNGMIKIDYYQYNGERPPKDFTYPRLF